jgi:hypothetical protein
MTDETKPVRKTEPVQSAIRALEKLTQAERVRVVKAAVALWGIAI